MEGVGAFLSTLRDPRLDPFRLLWPEAAAMPLRPVVPATIPVVRWLEHARAVTPPATAPLVAELLHNAAALRWQRTYTATQIDTAFLENYGWTEIAGLSGPFPSNRLACGFLLLGPGTRYPPHRHEAEEIYVPLSATARWQRGEEPWMERSPGSIVFHASGMPHALRAGLHPLLALYLWRSDNLNQTSTLVS